MSGSIPILGRKKIPFEELPLLAAEEIELFNKMTKELLAQGVPIDVPAVALPLGAQGRLGRTLAAYRSLLSWFLEIEAEREILEGTQAADALEANDQKMRDLALVVKATIETGLPSQPALVTP